MREREDCSESVKATAQARNTHTHTMIDCDGERLRRLQKFAIRSCSSSGNISSSSRSDSPIAAQSKALKGNGKIRDSHIVRERERGKEGFGEKYFLCVQDFCAPCSAHTFLYSRTDARTGSRPHAPLTIGIARRHWPA